LLLGKHPLIFTVTEKFQILQPLKFLYQPLFCPAVSHCHQGMVINFDLRARIILCHLWEMWWNFKTSQDIAEENLYGRLHLLWRECGEIFRSV